MSLRLFPSGRSPAGARSCPLFPRDNPWNQRIDKLPVQLPASKKVDPESAVVLDRGSAHLGSGSRENGDPRATVHDDLTPGWAVHDLSDKSERARKLRLEVLAQHAYLRVLVDARLASDAAVASSAASQVVSLRTAGGAVLVTTPDIVTDAPATWTCATRRGPTDEEQLDLDLAWRLVRGVTSNAIVLVHDRRLIGIGSGQTSRVDAARQAVEKARSILGGVGFTMALFIAGLAFTGAPALLVAAKLGILIASAVAGYEIGPRVGLCMGPEHIAQGWHSGATLGVFSAAAGAATAVAGSAEAVVQAALLRVGELSLLLGLDVGQQVEEGRPVGTLRHVLLVGRRPGQPGADHRAMAGGLRWNAQHGTSTGWDCVSGNRRHGVGVAGRCHADRSA